MMSAKEKSKAEMGICIAVVMWVAILNGWYTEKVRPEQRSEEGEPWNYPRKENSTRGGQQEWRLWCWSVPGADWVCERLTGEEVRKQTVGWGCGGLPLGPQRFLWVRWKVTGRLELGEWSCISWDGETAGEADWGGEWWPGAWFGHAKPEVPVRPPRRAATQAAVHTYL